MKKKNENEENKFNIFSTFSQLISIPSATQLEDTYIYRIPLKKYNNSILEEFKDVKWNEDAKKLLN